MTRKLHYGPHEIVVRDDQDLDALLDRIQEVANSGKAEWVEISDQADPHRILIQQGIPVYLAGTRPAKVRVGNIL